VEGTTSLPIFLPDLSVVAKSIASSMAESVAANAAKNAVSPTQTAANNGKKKGLLGRLFGHPKF
jgi:hypothetical protein